ncbi:Transcriptional regulator GlxA family, contains an amidase domain and an AraC-type DNA-binding HTH domain [Streptomyces sp. DvalAA-14]|uniref:GlxA family transcriptional regulator n=1 Tax=unclassified Streptomyces TaxID=2593676 RepID=UPI00081B1957|nr:MULTISPECIES: helix-turn-helix domain-containing protein [unclassified Streptomyces]MYS19388.1 helix-turn-helix domain-containing protein [Streptomyces sp. SID4948]SCD43291.1 Transcriptional regulator GlxA family, contains an amidase domain and an AraC-type DNA-binding HTH domain [Streptomyces sp. DvalAA-14]
MAGGRLVNVAAVLLDNVHPFELGVVCEVFGIDRRADGLPGYDFALVAAESNASGSVRAVPGFTISAAHGLERLEQADLIAVPVADDFHEREFPPELLAALRRAVDRGARVLSVCVGAFVLGAAGLLDGRDCTTHWRYSDALARRYPLARVVPEVLYVDDDPVITSAGTSAGIDACLYLVRKLQGSEVANAIARRMVVPPHRDGGQAQYIERPPARCGDADLGDVLYWMEQNVGEELTVDKIAAQAGLAPRTFARRFRQETGTTPYRWLLERRTLVAQELLESGDETVEAIAARTGFVNAAALRHQFTRALDTSPRAYRRAFRGPAPR